MATRSSIAEGLFAPHRSRTTVLSNGRIVSFAEFGQPVHGSVPIIYLHGYLGSRLEVGATRDIKGHVFGFDRPGYGRSDLCDRPSLSAAGDHIRRALDNLEIDRVAIIGVSAGAPYAAATAAALGTRVTGCLLAAGLGGPDVITDAGGSAIIFKHLGRMPVLARMYAKGFLGPAHRLGVEQHFLRQSLESDLKGLRDDDDDDRIIECMTMSLRAGFERGLDGPLNDLAVLGNSWDFDIRTITAPVVITHGTADRTVPAAHARWYARQLPHARVRLVPGERHVSFVANHANELIAEAQSFARTGEVAESPA
ncbi:MAG: alpha/beta hydrolase [Pseudomonadota bacterium]